MSTLILTTVAAVYVVISAPPVKSQPKDFDSYVIGKENSSAIAGDLNPSTTAPLTHWIIVVKIKPRPTGNGGATIMLIDNNGTTITTFSGVVLPYSGLAIGTKGPRRDIPESDTPFGVYKFAGTAGGSLERRLAPKFGTGKINLNDNDLFGEVADAKRKLIRLHGGGSALANPYALDQPLLRTQGCVRMKNRDVNDLIHRLDGLAPQNAVKFIFMGDDAYLNALATNATLSGNLWWPVLRVALNTPANPPSNVAVDTSAALAVQPPPELSSPTSENAAPQSSESLVQMVNLYAEDVGPVGEQALTALRTRTDELVSLQNSLPADDPLRPKLAFVLCNLDHDCEANMRVLQDAMTDPSRFRGSLADDVQEMISRLIDREDNRGNEEASTSLTRTLIEAAPNADGALSEGIGMTLSKQLRAQSGVFMSAWGEHFSTMPAAESTTSKSKVFALMRSSHRLTVAELNKIRRYLYSVREYSSEFGQAAKDFTEIYFYKKKSR